MTKINNITREKIAVVLLNHRFKPQGEALAARSDALFGEVYDAVYDAETRKLMAKLLKRHAGAFPLRTNANCTVDGWNILVGDCKIGWRNIAFNAATKERPYFYHKTNKFQFNHCEIAENLVKFATDCKAFTDQIQAASYELKSALGQINSVKQLRAAWPEVLPLIEHSLPAPGQITNLPAIQFTQLNDAYGLPPKTEGEAETAPAQTQAKAA